MRSMLLKFPSILGGNGDATAYLVLLLIIVLVGLLFYFVYRMLQQEAE